MSTAHNTMFNLYQSINKNKDGEEPKESQVIGHERWYQERSRSSARRKKRAPRRAHSASEFSPCALSAANRRVAFRNRSQSSENKGEDSATATTTLRVDSIAKIFFPSSSSSSGSGNSKRSSGANKHEYSALRTEGCSLDKGGGDNEVRNGVYGVCKHYLANSERYELRSHLGNIGSRSDKHCTRETLLDLFRGLQHPYIHPVLDVQFWDTSAAFITPLNPTGSLKDLIHGSPWQEDYDKKYACRGEGLPLRTVQCLGRQVLEGLLFLRNRHFPPFYHLHAGNVIIQNGVARLAGLENALTGQLPRPPSAPENLAFGYLLFEMASGYELATPPSPAHLQLELERAPRVAEALSLIFESGRSPTLEEVVCCDLFRGVELRELRGASVIQVRAPQDVLELLDIVRSPVPPSPIRRKDVVLIIEERRLEDILEEDNEDSDCSSSCSSSKSNKENTR